MVKMMMSCLVIVLSVQGYGATVCGDCDGDGWVSTLDALAAGQVAAGLQSAGWPSPGLLACDVASPQAVCSGSVTSAPVVTIMDALLIAQAAVGLPVSLSCCP